MSLALELLAFEPMASGERSLRLTATIGWDQFPDYAQGVVVLLGGKITIRSDSGDERVWTFERDGAQYWISFEDYSGEASIEPRDTVAGTAMEEIRATLLRSRPSPADE